MKRTREKPEAENGTCNSGFRCRYQQGKQRIYPEHLEPDGGNGGSGCANMQSEGIGVHLTLQRAGLDHREWPLTSG